MLKRLLEEDIEIVAVSGASAGALNGAALVAGLADGGRAGALAGLERLWKAVADGSPLRPFDHQWGGPLFEPWFRRSLELSKMMGRYVAHLSPQLREMRALRRVVASSIDLTALTRDAALPLYIAATAVSNGAGRLFGNDEITVDAIMASACLPDLFAAVTIDGEDYWDGGFSANPALEPLIFDGHGATDLLIVQITPFAVEDAPTSLGGIIGRMSDIGFNACLLREGAYRDTDDRAYGAVLRSGDAGAGRDQPAHDACAPGPGRTRIGQQARHPLVEASGTARAGPCHGGCLAG